MTLGRTRHATAPTHSRATALLWYFFLGICPRKSATLPLVAVKDPPCCQHPAGGVRVAGVVQAVRGQPIGGSDRLRVLVDVHHVECVRPLNRTGAAGSGNAGQEEMPLLCSVYCVTVYLFLFTCWSHHR